MNLDKIKSLLSNPKSFFYTKDETLTFLVSDWADGDKELRKKYNAQHILDICSSIKDRYSWYYDSSEVKDKNKKIKTYYRGTKTHPPTLLEIVFLQTLDSKDSQFTEKALALLNDKLSQSHTSNSDLSFSQSMNILYLSVTYSALKQKVFNFDPLDARLVWIKKLINVELSLYLNEKKDLGNIIFKMYVTADSKEKEFIEDILADVWNVKEFYRCLNNLEMARYVKDNNVEIDHDWTCWVDLAELFVSYPDLFKKVAQNTIKSKGAAYLEEANDRVLNKYGSSGTYASIKASIEKFNLENILAPMPLTGSIEASANPRNKSKI